MTDPLAHHTHPGQIPETSGGHDRRLLVLAGAVAVLCGVMLWLIINRHDVLDHVNDNNAHLRQLACEVYGMGGKPIPGVPCVHPSPSPTPRATRSPAALSPQPASTSPPQIVILPNGRATTIIVREPPPSASAAPSSRPSPTSTPDGSPSPSSTPLVCVDGRCIGTRTVPLLPTTTTLTKEAPCLMFWLSISPRW